MDVRQRLTSAALAYGEIVWVRRPDAGVKFEGGQRCPRAMVSRKAGSPGRSRISRKAIAQGRSDASAKPVCSCAAFLLPIAHETAGAARARPSLRPLSWEGRGKYVSTRAEHAARLRSLVTVKLSPCGMTMILLPLHELRERLRIIRMPARQRRAVFDDVAGGPGHAPLVELPRHVVVGAENVEITGIDMRSIMKSTVCSGVQAPGGLFVCGRARSGR